MPLVIDRRSFLKSTLAGAAAASFASRFALADPKPECRWALLSDVHIAADAGDTYRGFHPHANLKRVLADVGSKPFDGMLINGDLARLEGKTGDYEALSGHLQPLSEKMPFAFTMGNHDDRKNARSAFASLAGQVQQVEKKFVTVVDAGPVEFAMLDSLLATNVVPGQLGRSQREWLRAYVGNGSKPVVVFVHHNLDSGEDTALVDSARLLEILKPAKRVKAVLYGHTHAWNHQTTDGLHLVNIPAVAYNFKDNEPVGWTDASFDGKQGTLRLQCIGGSTVNDGQSLSFRWR